LVYSSISYISASEIATPVAAPAPIWVVTVSKCIPILMYGLEACPLIKSQLLSLDFAVNRFLWNFLEQAAPKL